MDGSRKLLEQCDYGKDLGGANAATPSYPITPYHTYIKIYDLFMMILNLMTKCEGNEMQSNGCVMTWCY